MLEWDVPFHILLTWNKTTASIQHYVIKKHSYFTERLEWWEGKQTEVGKEATKTRGGLARSQHCVQKKFD